MPVSLKHFPLPQWFHNIGPRQPVLQVQQKRLPSPLNGLRGLAAPRRGFRNPAHPHQTPGKLQKRLKEQRKGWRNPWIFYPGCAVALGVVGVLGYETNEPFRHTILAVGRCSRIAAAAVPSAVDYKVMMSKSYDSEEALDQAWSDCHARSATRVLKALLANGGVFIKMGQHMSSLIVLPKEWRETMRPLQDQCEATSLEDLEKLFVSDMGMGISELFDDFDPNPIGVASLAQVHVASHRPTGRRVAVKLQHPHLAEFCNVDMEMVDVTLGWIKYWFPDFEFSWLADEMRTNLPKEMDFIHEARNAERAKADFTNVVTSMYIPEIITATKRVLIMEYIQGARVDDLKYLADHNIDRNKVSIELSRIFSQMVFNNGWFHADPHPGNLLIRPSPPKSKSPYNFEIVLLDHGLYFDLEPQLRVNYSKLWLSLMEPASPEVIEDRRRYAMLVGNIGPDLYPVFEAALTGRAALEGSWDEDETPGDSSFSRGSSIVDLHKQSTAEVEAIRNAVAKQDGLLLSVFDVLRRVPRRVLMVLKLNDLTRGLDHALMTTHSPVRVFIEHAKFCIWAVWQDDRRRLSETLRSRGLLSISLFRDWFKSWWKYEVKYIQLVCYEAYLDFAGWKVQRKAWLRGLWQKGLQGARDAAAGLPVAQTP
ncbi:hypothetical protein D9611_003963 [Ephemerocybe angulata]|uniref:ABC1 atypical kinase-like domain-containing protein n=1 Tax=Ephemerocybe angulata TaxID=980116 RepID=A0A8H5EYC2_9AGAR|nr:hypothetical protein D9611_003963 [Tulosesus angulatus]